MRLAAALRVAFERAPVGAARLCERIQEDDDVRVSLGMVLVDPERTPPRARAPVHAAGPVTRRERTQVGELDPLPALARDVIAREDLRLDRAEQCPQLLLAWIDLERHALVELGLVSQQAKRVVDT